MKCKRCNGTGHIWYKANFPPPEEEESIILKAFGVDTDKEYKLEVKCPECAGRGKGRNHAYRKVPVLR